MMTMNDLPAIKEIASWNVFEKSNGRPLIIAGPCSAESEEQLFQTASLLKQQGISVIRAGLWKPRTRPDSFEGVGSEGLRWLQRIQQELKLKVGMEVAHAFHVEQALKAGIDLVWIGARTTTSPFAVQEIAEALRGTDIPVLIKNPVVADIHLWYGAIERLLYCNIKKVAAVHRGFHQSHPTLYRNAPQWQIPIELKLQFPGLPLFCDPSHISGNPLYLREICQTAMDLGFNGLMIESHIHPEEAQSDAAQQITPKQLQTLLKQLVIREENIGNLQAQNDLSQLREQINQLDNSILDSLSLRLKVAEEIGNYKKENNLTILQSNRWEEVLERLTQLAIEKQIDPVIIRKIYQLIHQASIDRQNSVMNQSIK